MRSFEFLTESVGLANRKLGDLWKNPQGEDLSFVSVDFYPSNAPNFETTEERDEAIQEIEKTLSQPIEWTNSPSSSMLGFGIASFKDESSNDVYFGRYFKSVSPNPTQNYFPNDLPRGYKLQTKAAKKEASGYQPSEVLNKFDNLIPADIISQIKNKFGPDSDEARAVQIFAKSNSFPMQIPLGKMDFNAFTNYFCEMLQPMALVMEKPVAGDAKEIEDKFFKSGGFKSAQISFSQGKTHGLSDSRLIAPDGQEILLSSKAGKGAMATTKNLYDKFEEVPSMQDKYPETFETVEIIAKGGSAKGLLNLAVKYNMIDSTDKDDVMKMKKLSAEQLNVKNLSDKLKELYLARKISNPDRTIPFYHMLAAIAYPLADKINQETDFSAAAADILNHGPLLQMYTKAKLSKDNIITLEPFRCVYPTTLVTTVKISAGKTYYSTGNKGNFVFEIK